LKESCKKAPLGAFGLPERLALLETLERQMPVEVLGQILGPLELVARQVRAVAPF